MSWVPEVLAGFLLGAVAAFFVGKAVSRFQVRHEQGAKALVEIRRRVLELKGAFTQATLPRHLQLPDDLQLPGGSNKIELEPPNGQSRLDLAREATSNSTL